MQLKVQFPLGSVTNVIDDEMIEPKRLDEQSEEEVS
jgi:hypothetical protein